MESMWSSWATEREGRREGGGGGGRTEGGVEEGEVALMCG